MKKKTFWLSYDLGLKGDYIGMYEWLDFKEARECGDSLAVFEFEYDDDFIQEILAQLKDNVEFKKGDRVYLIWKDEENRVKGSFIIGKRKPAPWEGYALEEEDYQVDVD